MDIIEDIVADYFYSKGYFLIKNLKAGLNEIDILAIKLNNNQKIDEAIHIEVHCSSKPIGYIGGSPSARRRALKEVELGVEDYIKRKFTNEKVENIIKRLIGNKYKKLFICGKLKEEETIIYFEKNDITVRRIWDILEDMKINKGEYKTTEGNRYHQLLYLHEQHKKINN